MNERKKINKTVLIIHFIAIHTIYMLQESLSPTWFDDYLNPDDALTFTEELLLIIITLPIVMLIVLWFKSLFNLVIPNIFNLKEINYWQSLGLFLVFWLLLKL